MGEPGKGYIHIGYLVSPGKANGRKVYGYTDTLRTFYFTPSGRKQTVDNFRRQSVNLLEKQKHWKSLLEEESDKF